MTLPAGWTEHKPGVWRKRVGKIGAEVSRLYGDKDWQWCVWDGGWKPEPRVTCLNVVAGSRHRYAKTRARAIAFCEAVIGVLTEE